MGKPVHVALLFWMLAAAHATAGPAAYRAPRTAHRVPDLSGLWTNTSLTALQRPSEFTALVASPQQADAFERPRFVRPPNREGDVVGGNDTEWFDEARLARIDGEIRTSWIVDPPDGRLPFKEEVRKALAATVSAGLKTEDPEQRPPAERCLLGLNSTSGAPMLNARFNSNYQFLQTHDALVIVSEMNHDARIVRLGAKGHPPPTVRVWMGDSIAWWEGDTLVVETTNMHPGEMLRPANGGAFLMSPAARVTERFTRTARDEIRYAFTVDDPETYTRVWRAEMPLKAFKGPLFEVACHEGNYGLTGILAGARAEERAAAAAQVERAAGPP